MEVGEEGEYIYTYRYTVTTRITGIKMGSDESHFNVSLIVRDKVTRQCPQTAIFEEKGEPKRSRTEVLPLTSLPTALPLSQTGSLHSVVWFQVIYTGIAESLSSRLLLCPGAVARASSVRECAHVTLHYTTL